MDLNNILIDHELYLKTGQITKKANLRRADLRWTDLRKANLRGANLRKADLRGADLRRADLCGANLRKANLRKADLRGADLCGADLCGADLRGADLQNTNIFTFQYQRHLAICNGSDIQIGCEQHSILEWLDNYEVLGEISNYNDKQIAKYGKFILMCAEEYL